MPAIATDPVFLSLRGFDPAVLENGVADDTAAFHTQVGRGLLDGELGRIPLVAGTMHTCRHSVAMRTQGQFPAGIVSVHVGLEVPSCSRVLSQEVGRDMLVAFGPEAVVDNLDGAGMHWASLTFPVAAFTRAVTDLTHREWSIDANPVVQRSPEREAIAALRALLAAVTYLARHQPVLFRDPKWCANAERSLQGACLGALLNARSPSRQSPGVSARRAHAIVRAVDDWLDTAGGGIVPVAELCRVARVPRRTLERAFESMFDFGPAEYMRRRALNAVRRALLGDTEAPTTVTDIAIRHGFWHLGRFAASYRVQFGESPSATLRRGRLAARPAAIRVD